MTIKIEKFTISTKGFDDVVDISPKIQSIVSSNDIREALVNISISDKSASILMLDGNLDMSNLPKLLDNIVPKPENVDELDANSELKASLLLKSVSIPFYNSRLALDNNQKIILLDFAPQAQNREIIVTLIY